MSNEQLANVMFARKGLQMLQRDLIDEQAISLVNTLDRALRLGDFETFDTVCASLPQIVSADVEAWRIKERLQVISLIRFPLHQLSQDEVLYAQRARVSGLTLNCSYSDRQLLSHAGRLVAHIVRLSSTPKRGFRHGPGVVAETSCQVTKRQVCYVAPSLRDFVSSIPDFPIVWRAKPSKTVLVPKDHKTLRVIAAEPTWTQWVQQGFKQSLMDTIVKHEAFRGHISFKDQELQRRLLKEPDIATIDLSDASDSIRVKHLLLLGLPLDVRQTLLCLRTPMTSYKDKILPTVGLFPMGAAVCFPFETLFFASLLQAYCYAEVGYVPSIWGVFGDDIIIPGYLAGGFCSFLKRVGLSPNLRKTFIGGNFFESCGAHLYKGIDVTPVKLKKSPPISQSDVNNISYTDYYAKLLCAYPSLAKHIATSILDESFSKPRVRWNSNYQRLEKQILVSKAKTTRGHWSFYPEALLYGSADVSLSVITTKHDWTPLFHSNMVGW